MDSICPKCLVAVPLLNSYLSGKRGFSAPILGKGSAHIVDFQFVEWQNVDTGSSTSAYIESAGMSTVPATQR